VGRGAAKSPFSNEDATARVVTMPPASNGAVSMAKRDGPENRQLLKEMDLRKSFECQPAFGEESEL